MRRSHFITGVAASYVALAATIIYGLALVPIALHYLPADEFGLWMVLVQISTYFTLLEFGVFPAAARTLIEYKDRATERGYGASILAAASVLGIQSVFILIAVFLLADHLVLLVSVPAQLVPEAISLLKWFVFASALGTFSKIWCAILYANHRMDLVALIQGLSPLLGLGIAWWILAKGYGLSGLPWAIIPPVIVAGCLYFLATLRLKLLPKWDEWRTPNLRDFRSLLALSTDVFLVNIGQQLLQASQLLIVSRTMGLTAAAIWSISTKLFSLIYQFVIKIDNTAIVAFAEMIVRKEENRLRLRFKHIYQVTAALAVVGFVSVAGLNQTFVSLWAGETLLWNPVNNWILATLLTFTLLLHCQTDLIIHTRTIGPLRFLVLLEGITFVSIALVAAPTYGFPSILVTALLCALIFRAPYCISRISALLNVSGAAIAFAWLRPALIGALTMTAIAVAISFSTHKVAYPWVEGTLAVLLYSAASIASLYFILLPRDLRSELINFFSKRRLRREGVDS